MNHETSPKLYWSYYPHRSRDSLSPVCGIFVYLFTVMTRKVVKSTTTFTQILNNI